MADQLIKATAADGGIRAVGVITTRLTEEVRIKRDLSYVATAALGRAMAAGLLLVSNMKTERSRINLKIKGDGPLGGLLVDAGVDGSVRGYVQNPYVELPPNAQGKLDVGKAVGQNGFLYVVRDVGFGYPYSSTVELVSGEIGEDVVHYLMSSEQTPSALLVGVFVDETGVTAAGGMLLQILPKAANNEEVISLLESRLSTLQGFTQFLREGKNLTEIFEQILGDLGLKIFPEVQMVRFDCTCNSDRMFGALKMVGVDELRDMINTDQGAEATCNFCGEVYRATCEDLEKLILELG
jgi:molecular chaperone Hsp33